MDTVNLVLGPFLGVAWRQNLGRSFRKSEKYSQPMPQKTQNGCTLAAVPTRFQRAKSVLLLKSKNQHSWGPRKWHFLRKSGVKPPLRAVKKRKNEITERKKASLVLNFDFFEFLMPFSTDLHHSGTSNGQKVEAGRPRGRRPAPLQVPNFRGHRGKRATANNGAPERALQVN